MQYRSICSPFHVMPKQVPWRVQGWVVVCPWSAARCSSLDSRTAGPGAGCHRSSGHTDCGEVRAVDTAHVDSESRRHRQRAVSRPDVSCTGRGAQGSVCGWPIHIPAHHCRPTATERASDVGRRSHTLSALCRDRMMYSTKHCISLILPSAVQLVSARLHVRCKFVHKHTISQIQHINNQQIALFSRFPHDLVLSLTRFVILETA